MAEQNEGTQVPEQKNPTKWGLIIGLIGVQIVLAFALVYFLILPRLYPQSEAEEQAEKQEEVKENKSKDVGVIITISDLTVNPKDSYGRRFAVFEIALEVPDEEAKGKVDKYKPMVVDQILQYLRSRTVAELTVALDIEQMKSELIDIVNQTVGEKVVTNLYFTRFVLE